MIALGLGDDANKLKPFRPRQKPKEQAPHSDSSDTSANKAGTVSADNSQDDFARGFMSEYPTDEVVTRLMSRLSNLHVELESVKAPGSLTPNDRSETVLAFIENGVGRLDGYLTSKTAVKRSRWIANAMGRCVDATTYLSAKYGGIEASIPHILSIPEGHKALLLGKAAVAMVSVINAFDCKVSLKYRNELVAYAYTSVKAFADGFLAAVSPSPLAFASDVPFGFVFGVRSEADRLDIETMMLFAGDRRKPTAETVDAAVGWLRQTRYQQSLAGREVAPDAMELSDDGEVLFEWAEGSTDRRLMVWIDGMGARYLKAWGADIKHEMEEGTVSSYFDDAGLLTWLRVAS